MTQMAIAFAQVLHRLRLAGASAGPAGRAAEDEAERLGEGHVAAVGER